ncbi:hypothetical protein NEHOM01_2451 [Nematocida homosporus]|uniref:uncharacterized protein n=1 Tax=Nematocida homosporus TaxID=1912981 RepID=UPI00221F8281|nr:uncharacterized protein NEHOM01_2451 [Nematocida homosporus]KAI5187929.1 hypothetical protein NEHOM01_2451 [Nematocida homosporus]
MTIYVILTTKGPVLLNKEENGLGRAVFAGNEYSVPFDSTENSDTESSGASMAAYAAMRIIQAQSIGRSSHKKKLLKITALKPADKAAQVTSRHPPSTGIADLLISGLSHMFRSKILGKKKKISANDAYAEGLFSSDSTALKRSKLIEPLAVFETETPEELFTTKYSIVLHEETEVVVAPPVSEIETSVKDSGILAGFEQNFFASELSFIRRLVQSKQCIQEIGKWLYNIDHTAIFSSLLHAIEMFFAAFANSVLRALPQEVLGADVDLYVAKEASADYAAMIYTGLAKQEAAARLVEAMGRLEGKKGVFADLQLSFGDYLSEIARVLYSPEFIKYIRSVEDSIARYRSAGCPEIAAAERKFQCNLCFLFVDLYHRVIKYKMYTEEAIKCLKKQSAFYEAASLTMHMNRLDELLKAAERFKKIHALNAAGVVFPDCADDFVDSFELTNGVVIITRTQLLFAFGGHITAVVDKKEVVALAPENTDEEPSEYLDLALSCLYPPMSGFVVDCVNGRRVHWVRLHFRWDGYVNRFIAACKDRNVSNISGLDLRLHEKSVQVNRLLRPQLPRADVRDSHRRMLSIRAARKIVRTFDAYDFGLYRRLPEEELFHIKAILDSMLATCAASVACPGSNPDANVFERDLASEIIKVVDAHVVNPEGDALTMLPAYNVTVSEMARVCVEYLGYILRVMDPQDFRLYSKAAMGVMRGMCQLKDATLSNDEFLNLAAGCVCTPTSLNRNEFLLSLVTIRVLLIIAPEIGSAGYLSVCAPLFIFNSRDLLALL